MRFLFICLLMIIVPLEWDPVAAGDTVADTTQAHRLIDEWEAGLSRLDHAFKEALWILYTTGDLGDLPVHDAARMEFLNDPALFDQISTWRGTIRDPLLIRKIEMFYRVLLEAKIDNYGELYELLDELSGTQTNFRAEFEGRETDDGELGSILRHEESRERRKSAFLARATVGNEIGDDLSRLFSLRAEAARELGFGDYYTLRLSLDEISPPKLQKILSLLEELTRPAYGSFLIRQREALGVETIEAWDLLYDTSGITRELETHLPPDSMVARTWRTYKGMGILLDSFTIQMDLEPREGKSQHAMCVSVDPPGDIRILANSREGLLSSELMLHEMGHAVHSASFRQDSHLLRDFPSGSFGEGIGEFFGQLVYTKEWLTTVAGIPEKSAQSYLEWRLDRRLFTVRWYLAAIEFEKSAYANPEQDLSVLYWEMLNKYLLIPSHPEIKVWAQIPHFITHPVYLQNYILADLMAAQLRAYFRDRFGGILNHAGVGRILTQEFFHQGSSVPGEELLYKMTGSELDPKPFAEEF